MTSRLQFGKWHLRLSFFSPRSSFLKSIVNFHLELLLGTCVCVDLLSPTHLISSCSLECGGGVVVVLPFNGLWPFQVKMKALVFPSCCCWSGLLSFTHLFLGNCKCNLFRCLRCKYEKKREEEEDSLWKFHLIKYKQTRQFEICCFIDYWINCFVSS